MSDTPRTDAKTQYPLPDRQLRYLEMCDHARTLERENVTLRTALARSIVAIDDWLHTYAGEFCGEEYVKATVKRISDEGGTLGYITDVQEQNRAALGPLSPACIGYPDCDGDLVATPHSEKCPRSVAVKP